MRIFIIIIGVAWALLLWGCDKDVDLDIQREPPRLAVYAIINPDSVISVWVTRTKFVLDAEAIRAVDNATVTITPEGQAPRLLTLKDALRGQYRADFAPQAGVTYYLNVTADGFPPVEATTRVPLPVRTTLSYDTIRINALPWCAGIYNCDSTILAYTMVLTWKDPAPDENFYEVVDHLYYLEPYTKYDSIRDEYIVLSDTTGDEPSRTSNDPLVRPGEVAQEQNYRTREEFRFTDQLLSGQTYTFQYNLYSVRLNPVAITVALRSYHPEAYRYQQGKRAQETAEGFEFAYEPVQIPQNIQGGYGIFSSYSEDKVIIELP